jgi:exonuclease SbcD
VRFLHTADWHIGKPLRGRSRIDEYCQGPRPGRRRRKDKEVDAVLIAGDVFDSPAPPPEAEKLVYNFLAKLVAERIQCVLIAGNHDHPRKLDALAALLESLGIHVRHEVRPPDQGGVVTLRSKDGKEEAQGRGAAVRRRRKGRRRLLGDGRRAQVVRGVRQAHRADPGGAREGPAAHDRSTSSSRTCWWTAPRVGTGERELHLGQIYGVNPQQLPSSVQYIALGHLHRPQEVLAPAKTLYPGSLVELDFGEEQQDKSVVVFEAQPQGAPKLELVPITAGRRLRTVHREARRARALRERVDRRLPARARESRLPTPGLAERVKELLPNALDVTVDHPRDPAQLKTNGGEGRVKLAPSRLFAAYYEHRHNTQPSKELQQLFDRSTKRHPVRPHKLTLEASPPSARSSSSTSKASTSSRSPARPAPASRR